jgi:predicted phage-related endonuclease
VITLNVVQGSPEWHAARARCGTASEAPAMMGAGKYQSRAALLQAKKTGVAAEITEDQQRRFDDGHAAEAAARALVEQDLGEDLYPMTATTDDGRLLASFDGVTLDGSTGFEHKLWNEDLAALVRAGELGPDYYWQLEQQLLVGELERILFTVSDGTRARWAQLEYRAVPGRREQLLLGWTQFEEDLGNYVPPAPVAPRAAGRAPEALPALRIELTGLVTASNLEDFRDHAIAVFQGISTDLQTDQDFADAERTVKWCGDIEERLAAAKQHALSQTESIDALFRAIDAISAEARSKRLELNKLVTTRKEAVRGEIVQRGRDAVTAHFDAINATLGEHRLPLPATLSTDLGAAIKGKRTVTSMVDAVDSVVTRAKIDASGRAESVRANVAILAQFAEHAALFPDRVALCASKTAEDLRNLVATRIADQKQREEARLEADRAKIRAEEEERARAAVPAPASTPTPEPVYSGAPATTFSMPAPAALMAAPAGLPAPSARIKLGDINARIAPLAITAEGLTQLGFASVGTERAAKLYNASDFPLMCAEMVRRLTAAVQAKAA